VIDDPTSHFGESAIVQGYQSPTILELRAGAYFLPRKRAQFVPNRTMPDVTERDDCFSQVFANERKLEA